MHMEELIGKKVVETQAKVLGEVIDIEFDEKTMQLTKICLKLNENIVEEMGLKKPRLIGSVKADLPITVIKAISDVVTLNRSAKELGPIAVQH
ncbi:MAG: hypothetical protein QG670_1783 [Thermoproteota archaeon]|nr:hypothetical protein [Thermoproteota archaeon]